jgi:hypothetical protein
LRGATFFQQEMKLQHWRGFQAIYAPKAATVLEFVVVQAASPTSITNYTLEWVRQRNCSR